MTWRNVRVGCPRLPCYECGDEHALTAHRDRRGLVVCAHCWAARERLEFLGRQVRSILARARILGWTEAETLEGVRRAVASARKVPNT
jgi:hypothetical protein